MTPAFCPACRRDVSTADALADHNLVAATSGERSYEAATNVPARTVEAKRTAQGGGVHGRKGLT